MRVKTRLCVLAACIFMSALLAGGAVQLHAEQIYRWKDQDGNINFGDKPPASNAEIVTVRPSAVEDQQTVDRFERTNKLLDTLAEDRQAKKDARAAVEAERKERIEQCAQARNELEQLRTAQFVYSKDKAGQRQILSFERRAQAERAAAAKVSELCRRG